MLCLAIQRGQFQNARHLRRDRNRALEHADLSRHVAGFLVEVGKAPIAVGVLGAKRDIALHEFDGAVVNPILCVGACQSCKITRIVGVLVQSRLQE